MLAPGDFEALLSPVARPPHGFYGIVDVDVTEVVQKWADADGNFGWVLSTGGSDAWRGDGMDADDPGKRPRLAIEFSGAEEGE